MQHEHYGPDSYHDVPDRAHGKTREQVLHERRLGELDLSQGPKPFGWFGEEGKHVLFCITFPSLFACHSLLSFSGVHI